MKFKKNQIKKSIQNKKFNKSKILMMNKKIKSMNQKIKLTYSMKIKI